MNISKITLSSPSFRQVTREAAKQAIRMSNNVPSRLNSVYYQVKQQSTNYLYDVRLNKNYSSKPPIFGVYRHGNKTNCLIGFNDFGNTCLCASGRKDADIANGIQNTIPDKTEQQEIAEEILSLCIDD